MITLRVVSDLHLEFQYDLYDSVTRIAENDLLTVLPPLETDAEGILVVAGDLATARRVGRIITFLKLVVPRFKHIIYVLGNHEHYGMRLAESQQVIEDAIMVAGLDTSKITVAGNTATKIKIEDVTFLCATMWTDYNRGDPLAMGTAKRYINDHRSIIAGDGDGVSPALLAEIHADTIQRFSEWMDGSDNSKTVVVTHHMPSLSAVDPQYMTDDISKSLNFAFASDLDALILKNQPAFWFFGHTHTSYEGKIENTIISCNPLGYPNERNKEQGRFKTSKVFSL